MEVLDQYGAGEGDKLMQQYNIFGDCSMMIRSKAPTGLSVTHAASVPATGTFAVQVDDQGGPLAGATVAESLTQRMP